MKRPAPAVFTLIVFWALYAIAAAWTLYQTIPPVSRNLLLILGGYAAVLAILTVAIALRDKFVRFRRDL